MSGTILDRLLPRSFDATYRGQKTALWLFALLLLIKLAMSVNAIINGRAVAMSADGIPLDAFPADAASAIVSFFALLGLSRLTSTLLGILVFVRYRSMVPLMFVLFLIEHVARFPLLRALPLTRVTTPTAIIVNSVLLAIMIAGTVLSLWPRADER